MNKFRFCSRRLGQGSVELMMSLLFFVMMLGTLMSISFYLYLHHVFLTAAKEGARAASVESNLANATTYNTGVTNVRNWVVSFVQASAGITVPPANITVTGPTGATTGNRTVQVQVTFQFTNPVQIRTFINRLGGGAATGLDNFTITNNATMRYEE